MLVTSDGSTPLLSALQLDELIQLHAVEPEDVVHLGFSDRACGEPSISSGDTKHKNSLKGIPMIDHADEFNKRVMSWIENVV